MKRHRLSFAIFLIAASALSTGAAAQNASQTWRCGNQYSDQPCAGGRVMSVDDARSDAERRRTDAATRGAQRSADQLERERLRREALAQREGRPIVIPTPHTGAAPAEPKATGKKKHKRGKESEYFTAREAGAPAKPSRRKH